MTVPRVLLGVDEGPVSYESHTRLHGEMPHRAKSGALIAELATAALRGKGGGEFPLARKLDAVRRSPGTPAVVVNACEGEPMSVKDRVLVQAAPHLVLDGALCCAAALGATDLVIATDALSVAAGEAVEDALAERNDLNSALEPTIVEVPPGYVSGQETALISYLNGGPPIPQRADKRVTERGIGRRPTLVSNAETLAHAALIARHGARWFRTAGTAEEPGTVLVTLSGPVRDPGVYEIEYDTTLSGLLEAAGGLVEPASAFLIGGYAGTWIDADQAPSIRLSRAGLRPLGASLGAGIIVALPERACPVAEVTRVAGWMAGQSAGQCGPCVHGLAAVATALSSVRDGHASDRTLADIRRWCRQLPGRGACAHPDGAVRFVASALTIFDAEFEDHRRFGPCDACELRTLATPARRHARV
jgi:NADH:ubiquinone oxidoreductase subunit F (NADH-binding)